jgi:hypothetical protein
MWQQSLCKCGKAAQSLSRMPEDPTPLPRRDWVLLPLVSLSTILLLVGVSEAVARVVWPDYRDDQCVYFDPKVGYRERPNCVMHIKNAEGPAVDYQFNECSSRSDFTCAKQPGSLRLLVVGSSIAMGAWTPYDQLFGVRAAKELSRLCNRAVDFQDTGTWNLQLSDQVRLMDEAFALQPDAIFMPVAPVDLREFEKLPDYDAPPVKGGLRAGGRPDAHFSLMARVLLTIRDSRAMLFAQHCLLLNNDFLFRAYQYYGQASDPLHVPFSPQTEERFAKFDEFMGRLEQKMKGQNNKGTAVPFYVIALPNRVGAAMASHHVNVPGTDPNAFSQRIAQIARAHGFQAIDPMPDFAQMPNGESAYYPVDGHPNALAHELLSHLVVRRLLDGSAPAFSNCRAGEKQ